MIFPLPIFYILFAGLMVGFFIATTGAMKDVRWEGFSRRKFVRSPIIAVIWAILLSMIFEFNEWIILALCAGMLERLTVEIWKMAIRKKPSKFNNPERDTRWFKN